MATSTPSNSLDFEIFQGATFIRILSYTDQNDDPIDISAWTFVGQIRRTYSDGTVLATFVFDRIGLATNQIRLTLSASSTTAIPVPLANGPGRKEVQYIYDIKSTTPDETIRSLQGAAFVSPEVTKP